MANPLTWVDSSGDDSWETASNWSDAYAAPHVPNPSDVVYVNGQHNDNLITLNTQQSLNNLIIQSAGNNYTFGTPGSTSGLYFSNYYTGIFVEGNLVGSNGGATFNAPIESTGGFFLSNFSPVAPTTVPGMNGYNNTLTIAGQLQVDNNSSVTVVGDGNVNITGNITGTTHYYQDSTATTTFSGTNNFTGWVIVAGTLVLNNTVNNTDKLSEGVVGKDPALVLGENNNGGHLVINGNEAGTAEYLSSSDGNGNTGAGHLDIRGGTNTVILNGSTDGGGATTLTMGALADNFDTTLDFTANGNSAFYTTTTNNGQYGAQVNILGQNFTYNKMYYAQVGNGFAYQGTAGYGVNTAETQITALVNDDGTAFNSQWANFHVAADPSGTQLLSGINEGADTIRFASDSAHTLDLNGGTMQMVYGGVLVAQNVTQDTAIINGTMLNNRDLFGMTILNYSSHTLTLNTSFGDVRGNTVQDSINFGGGGKIILGGDSSTTMAPGSTFYINSGVVQLTNNNALGVDNGLNMGDATSVLDLNGHSIHIAGLTSDANFAPGNQAAAAGLNTNIENTAVGTLSRITIEGWAGSGGNIVSNFVDQDVSLGHYYGGLNEVSGSIISLDIEKGSAAGRMQFDIGTADAYGDPNQANVTDPSGVQGPATQITGAIIIGAGANLGLLNYGNVQTMGATVLNGSLGAAGQQAADYATTYFTGTGAIVSGYGFRDFDLNTVGSATDTFAGNFGSSTVGASMGLVLSGTGTVSMPAGIFANINTEGASTLVTTAQGAGGLFLGGISNVYVTGNSGTVLGSGPIDLYGGSLHITPSGSGADVVVYGNNNSLQPAGGHGAIILDKGANNSLTLEVGNTSNPFFFYGYYAGSLEIGSVQGIAALGTTDRLVALSSGGGNIDLTFVRTAPEGTVINESSYAQDDSVGGTKAGSFLAYYGNGSSTDAGFMAYQYNASQIDNLNSGVPYSSNEKIDTNYSMTTSAYGVYTLEIDNGATLNTNGNTLDMSPQGGGYTNAGGIILNGATINGEVTGGRSLTVYTSLANGWINGIDLYYGGQPFSKTGPGTLFVGKLTNEGNNQPVTIDEGTLDLGVNYSGLGPIILNGGSLEVTASSLSTSFTLGNTFDDIVWSEGGFAAHGAPLTLTVFDGGGAGSTLTWGVGGSSFFLGEGAVMSFGAPTADSQITFLSNINLGLQYAGVNGQDQLYSRVINVIGGTGDTGDRIFYRDEVIMEGTISSGNPYIGLSKTGTGTLVVLGDNTYTGATMIAQGELAINSDINLGTAPTAAYALNTTPGVNGAALTPGAIEINGGAALGIGVTGNDAVISSTRQMLLASGTDGSSAAIIDVAGGPNPEYGYYSTLSFGGIIADYIGEIGSLEKQGGGIFNYSGTAYNTGSFAVTSGTLMVSGSGNINSASGVTINNKSSDPDAVAQFNYGSTVGLTKTVTFGAGGGVFAYNSPAAYTGASSINLTTGQTVAGKGNLSQTAVTVGAGGTITPGNISGQTGTASVGALTTGALTLLSGGNYNFLIADTYNATLLPGRTGGAGIGYSTINAASVDLSGLSAAAPFNLNLETLAGNLPGAPANFNPLTDYDFVLISTGVAGGITPESTDELDGIIIVHPEANNGTTGFDPAPDHWYMYESADNSTLYLHYSAVPEPGTWAMILGGIGLLVFIRRMRSRVS